jgi:hypothetical protein
MNPNAANMGMPDKKNFLPLRAGRKYQSRIGRVVEIVEVDEATDCATGFIKAADGTQEANVWRASTGAFGRGDGGVNSPFDVERGIGG